MTTPLGQLIRQKCKALGLTQEQLAKELGVDVRAVKRWWSGENVPRHYLPALVQRLEISALELAEAMAATPRSRQQVEADDEVESRARYDQRMETLEHRLDVLERQASSRARKRS